MKLMKAKFGYNQKFTLEEQEKIREAVLGDKVEFSEDGEYSNWYNESIIDFDLLPNKAIESLSIIKIIEHKSIDQIQARARSVINQRVNVAVPGFGLMAIKTVKVEVDLCTEKLQEQLDLGWQILAICVQPDQRRPDYVLGKPEVNNGL